MTDNKSALEDNVSVSREYQNFWERIDKYIAELKEDKCNNDHDCEHCDWVECPEMEGE